jgi:hypothetical protein
VQVTRSCQLTAGLITYIFALCHPAYLLGNRRRTLTPQGGPDTASAVGRVSSSSTPPIGGSSSGGGLPVPEYVGQLGPLQEEHGPDSGGRQMLSLASRLSHQALSEIKEK